MRFFAAAAVVAYHCERYIEPLRGAESLVGFGYTGVTFFFLLSGFVLTWNYRPHDSMRDFYWRRFARVWPLHALTTLAAGLMLASQGRPQSGIGLALTLPLVQAWAPPGDMHYAYNGLSWSLSCEAFFYAVFPFLAIRLTRWRAGTAALIVAALMLGGAALVFTLLPRQTWGFLLYVNPAFRIGEFALGMILALAMRDGWRPRWSLGSASALLALSFAAMLALGRAWSGGDLANVPMAVADGAATVPFLAVIAAAAAADVCGDSGWLAKPRLIMFGNWSFALYLVHELALRWAAPLYRGASVSVAASVATAICLGSLALAGALYQFFEHPIEQRLRAALSRGSTTVRDTSSIGRTSIPGDPR